MSLDAGTSAPAQRKRVQRVVRSFSSENGTNKPVTIERIDITGEDGGKSRSKAWLGLSTSEAPEALTSQLGLEPGLGLVVDYIEPDGPAALAGLEKHDLLLEFAGYSLSHPAQLRRLVQARNEGDAAELVYLRKGKNQKTNATLGKDPGLGLIPFEDGQNLDLNAPLRGSMKALRESMGNIKIDHEKLQNEIRIHLERARQSMRDSLSQMTNNDETTKALKEAMQNLVGEEAKQESRVVVRSSSKNAKSLVRTDDKGTIVLIKAPKLRLTAHDPSGKLLFDGPIETEEERVKVPGDLWERVSPLVKELNDNLGPRKAESEE